MTRVKNDLYKLYKLEPTNGLLHHKYKSASRSVQTACRKAKKEFYTNLLDKCKTNQKKYWSVVHSVTGKGKTKIKSISVDEGNIPVDGNEFVVSEHFNKYFRNSVNSLLCNANAETEIDYYIETSTLVDTHTWRILTLIFKTLYFYILTMKYGN